MTGIERLRELAGTLRENIGDMQLNSDSGPLWRIIDLIADQIVREHAEDCFRMGERAAEDAEAIAWVREHGGLSHLKEEWNHSRNLKRSLETAQAKVERQQRHIEFVQRKCRERQGHICELNRLNRAYVKALNGVCKRLGLTDGTGLPDMPEVIWTELDRRLVPEGMEWLVEAWPRYEDGEPVKFGDMALIDGEADMVEAIQLWIHGKPVIYGDGGSQQLERGERVKRPAPEDSWERLEEDAEAIWTKPIGYGKSAESTITCRAVDLVRRAKALAGRDAS